MHANGGGEEFKRKYSTNLMKMRLDFSIVAPQVICEGLTRLAETLFAQIWNLVIIYIISKPTL
jgi:hypothetical protein